MFYKEIVCLANSRKLNGKCVAGKDISTHNWIRPISGSEKGELTDDQIAYGNGEIPELLDIVKIPFEQTKATFYQTENILISNGKWEKIGKYSENELDDLCDSPPTIWINEGLRNDRISEDFLERNRIESSLLLIKIESLKFKRENRTDEFGNTKKKLRAIFSYNNVEYNLVVTDPVIENEYRNKDIGIYVSNSKNAYLCISLGEPFNGYCYKLVAGVIKNISS